VASNTPNGSGADWREPEDAPRTDGSRATSKKSGKRWLVRLIAALVALLAAFLVGRFTAPKSTVNATPVAVTNSSSPSPSTGTGGQFTPTTPSATAATSGDPSATTSEATVGPNATGLNTVTLANLTAVSGAFDNGDKTPVVNGQPQNAAVSSTIDSCYGNGTTGDTQYNLGRDYTKLTAVLGVDDNSASQNAAPQVEIDGDGLKLGTWTPTLGKPVNISLNVTNVLRLDIKWTDPGVTCENYKPSYLVLGNGELTPVPGFVTTLPSSTSGN
jgi:hypothetical protein